MTTEPNFAIIAAYMTGSLTMFLFSKQPRLGLLVNILSGIICGLLVYGARS